MIFLSESSFETVQDYRCGSKLEFSEQKPLKGRFSHSSPFAKQRDRQWWKVEKGDLTIEGPVSPRSSWTHSSQTGTLGLNGRNQGKGQEIWATKQSPSHGPARVVQRSPYYLREQASSQEMIIPANSLTNVANCFHLGAISVLQGSAVPGIQGDGRLMGKQLEKKTIRKSLGFWKRMLWKFTWRDLNFLCFRASVLQDERCHWFF